jgi:hypothetical protein
VTAERAIRWYAGLCVPELPWTGHVERRDPEAVRVQSVQLTWRCNGPHCRQWTMNGAHIVGRCNFCNTPR